jgi:molybdopterin biosynthesis enzyme MoaB
MSRPSIVHVLASHPSTHDAVDTAAAVLREAGLKLTVSGEPYADGVQPELRRLVAPGTLILVVGGMGLRAEDTTAATIRAVIDREVREFATLAALVGFRDLGAHALTQETVAGFAGGAVIVGLPNDEESVERILTEVLIPTLADLMAAATSSEIEGERPPQPPAPQWRLGGLTVNTDASPIVATTPEGTSEIADRGWTRAVHDLGGEIVRGKAADIPQSVEGFAPFMDLLHQAGERARLVLPSGKSLDLYGFPDLQRPGSRVLAVGWGEPLAEVVALHRYPAQAGVSIDEAHGLMPRRSADVTEVAQAVTGTTPTDATGTLFAVDHDAVYIERAGKVYRWDGRRERQEGNPKQALVTLALGWHTR